MKGPFIPLFGEGDRGFGDLTLRGLHRRLAVALPGQRAKGPVARTGEEPKLAVRGSDDLGGELPRSVEQPHERTADGLAASRDGPLNHGFLCHVDPFSGKPASLCSAHAQTSFSIGTPTSEPYSVHEPS